MTGPGRNSDACRGGLLPGEHRREPKRPGSRTSGLCSSLIPCLLRLIRFPDEQDPIWDRFLFTMMFAHSDVLSFFGKNPVAVMAKRCDREPESFVDASLDHSAAQVAGVRVPHAESGCPAVHRSPV